MQKFLSPIDCLSYACFLDVSINRRVLDVFIINIVDVVLIDVS